MDPNARHESTVPDSAGIEISRIDPARILAELARRNSPLGRPLAIAEVTTSTNDDAKRAAEEGAPSGAAFLANAQTRGRGRLGRTWHSPPDENLYASFLLRPSLDPKRASLVTLASGLAVADTLEPLVPHARITLKWPNDVLIDDRKVAGILSEARLSGEDAWIVVGIGINVHTRAFPADLAARATSLALSGATTVDRSDLFVAVASALSARLDTLRTGASSTLVESFAARDALAGRPIAVDGAPAIAIGIARDGALRIRHPDGTESFCIAGDVQLRE
jgi:BirA family transcriptional regulator, biotin operon repressor / biotin---[acetyl-CoA-carboxylase] ligase